MGLYGSPELGLFEKDERMPKRRKPKAYIPKWIGVVAVIIVAYFLISKLDSSKIAAPSIPNTIGNAENVLAVGSRKNPAKINQPVQVDLQDQSGNVCQVEATLIDFRRGEEANKILQSWHSAINPGDEKEYGLVKFRIKYLKDKSGNDIPFTIASTNFAYSTGDYKVSDLRWNVPGMDPDIKAQLYEGAEHQGWVCFSIEANDAAPKVVFAQTAWFDLVK
jgi:hypothetical protein